MSVLYFKHTDLVNDYHVSLKTVHNWIASAKSGTLDLRLHEQNGRAYVANTPGNILTLEHLANKGKKYRNTLHHKIVTPKPEFYTLYTRRQILDIISNLATYHEIPRQYNYMDGGADNWDSYARGLWREETPNLLRSTARLLKENQHAIDGPVHAAKRVNIIDIGPGNGLPVRGLVQHLLESGKLNRYIAIDISKDMLRILEKNFKLWFGDKVKFEGYVRDFTYERFDDLLVDDMLGGVAEHTINLAALLGGTIMNFPAPYDAVKVIRHSLSQNDLVIYNDKPDNEVTRRYFNFNPESGSVSTLSPNHRFIFDLLNINDSLYEVEMGFNEQKRVRFIRVRLKVSLTIQFDAGTIKRQVELNKGDTILLWRAWHQTMPELVARFEDVGLALLQSSMAQDGQHLLAIFGMAIDSTDVS